MPIGPVPSPAGISSHLLPVIYCLLTCLPPSASSSTAPATSSPEATPPKAPAQAPAWTAEAVGRGIAWVIGLHRGHIGRAIGAVAGVHGAIWIAPSPRPAGHRAHSGRAGSIQPWHLTHLPSVTTCQARALPLGKTPASSSARATAISVAASERTPRPRRQAQPAGEAGPHRGPSGRSLYAHRRPLQPGVTIRRLPWLVRQPHGAVPLAATGQRPLALRPCAIESGHVLTPFHRQSYASRVSSSVRTCWTYSCHLADCQVPSA